MSSAEIYVDKALAQLRRFDLLRVPGEVPAAMRDPSIEPREGWSGWKAVPSTVADGDLDRLERETGLAYPPLYRDFLKYRHFLWLTEVGLRFESHPCNDWRERLRALYFEDWDPARILGRGLLPFGHESLMDAGPACFDTRRRREDGDCPVVFWDHDLTDTEEEIRPLFSSCAGMFACLALAADSDFSFIYHDPAEDPPDVLPEKRQRLRAFLAADPAGAGAAARPYWTAWGVEA